MADEIGQSGEHKRAEGDASDAGDGDSVIPLPLFVFITQEEFEARLAGASEGTRAAASAG